MRGDKRALFFEDDELTFADIAERVKRIAGGLAAAGVGVGARVGLMMASRPEFIFFEQAIFALGAIVSPLNIFYRKNELLHAILSCDLEYLVISDEYLDRLPGPQAPGIKTLKKVFFSGEFPDERDPRMFSADELARAGAPIKEAVQIPRLLSRTDAQHERYHRQGEGRHAVARQHPREL